LTQQRISSTHQNDNHQHVQQPTANFATFSGINCATFEATFRLTQQPTSQPTGNQPTRKPTLQPTTSKSVIFYDTTTYLSTFSSTTKYSDQSTITATKQMSILPSTQLATITKNQQSQWQKHHHSRIIERQQWQQSSKFLPKAPQQL
jgi:hypothetical protein